MCIAADADTDAVFVLVECRRVLVVGAGDGDDDVMCAPKPRRASALSIQRLVRRPPASPLSQPSKHTHLSPKKTLLASPSPGRAATAFTES